VKIGENMYAIIESGGKQYKAAPGETIEVDRLQADEGSKIKLDRVLLVSNEADIKIGTPVVEGAVVEATILEHFKGRKIIVFKYKPRNRYRRKMGHRQQYTRLHIDDIKVK
jgi:large subunit ribosomal protein L21